MKCHAFYIIEVSYFQRSTLYKSLYFLNVAIVKKYSLQDCDVCLVFYQRYSYTNECLFINHCLVLSLKLFCITSIYTKHYSMYINLGKKCFCVKIFCVLQKSCTINILPCPFFNMLKCLYMKITIQDASLLSTSNEDMQSVL